MIAIISVVLYVNQGMVDQEDFVTLIPSVLATQTFFPGNGKPGRVGGNLPQAIQEQESRLAEAQVTFCSVTDALRPL